MSGLSLTTPDKLYILENETPINLGMLAIANAGSAPITLTIEKSREGDLLTPAQTAGVDVSEQGKTITLCGAASDINAFLAETTLTPKGILGHNLRITVEGGGQSASGWLTAFTKLQPDMEFDLSFLRDEAIYGDGIPGKAMGYGATFYGAAEVHGATYNPANGRAAWDGRLESLTLKADASGILTIRHFQSSDGAQDYDIEEIVIRADAEPIMVKSGQTAISPKTEMGTYLWNFGLTSGAQIAGGIENVNHGGKSVGAVISLNGAQTISGGAAAESASIMQKGNQTILSGGTATGTVIASGGGQTVSAGGKSVNTVLNGGGSQIVADGGTASSTTLNGSGYQRIVAGGVAWNASITSGQQYVYGTAHSTYLTSGASQILEDSWYTDIGGIAYDTIVDSGSVQKVTGRNTKAVNTTLMNGASQIVADHGVASGTILRDSSLQTITYSSDMERVNGKITYVTRGGSAYDTIVGESCGQGVQLSCIAFNTILRGGRQGVYSGGTASSTIISQGGSLYIDEGGVASGVAAYSGGSMLVRSGGSALDIEIFSGGKQEVYFGGYVSGGVIHAGGSHCASRGALVYDITIEGGSGSIQAAQTVAAGAVTQGVNLVSGAHQLVSSGGVAIGTTVDAPSLQEVFSGGVASNATLMSQARQWLNAGAKAYGTVVSKYAVQEVLEGASALHTEILVNGSQNVNGAAISAHITGGIQDINGGGSATATLVGRGGWQRILSGGIASGAILADGLQDIYSSGTALDTLISSGGIQTVNNGGMASGITILAGGVQTVTAGGSALNVTVSSGGWQRVYSGGYVSGGIVRAGGSHIASSGAIIYGLTVEAAPNLSSGGTITSSSIVTPPISSGGTITSSSVVTPPISSGGTITSSSIVTPPISSGGTITSSSVVTPPISSGGTITSSSIVTPPISSGGTITSSSVVTPPISSGGTITSSSVVTPPISSGGTITSSGGVLIIHKGAIASKTNLKGGSQIVSSGGKAVLTSIAKSAVQIIHAGAVASSSVIKGSQHVNGGRSLKDQIKAGGWQFILSRGTASGTIVSKGGRQILYKGAKARGANVSAGASQVVYGGGSALLTTVKAGGKQYASGLTSATLIGGIQYLRSGGRSIKDRVQSGGAQRISKGGLASGAIISKGGKQVILSGGHARGGIVSKGGSQIISKLGVGSAVKILGTAIVASGGLVRGLNIGSGGILKTYKGARIQMTGNANVSGSMNLNGATVTGTANAVMKLATSKASITLGTNVAMRKNRINVNNGRLIITGSGNSVQKILTTAKSATTFDIRNVSARGTAYMVSAGTKSALNGKVSISTKALQNAGTYELGKNLARSSSKAITILTNGRTTGALKIGATLRKNGLNYKVTAASNALKLSISARAGLLKKGTAKADKLTGGANCDIFYGGKGNDRISGKGGRDVTVYDKNNWGRDTIEQGGNGTMTILFSDIKSSQITRTLKGKNMVISRKDASGQSITVKNWNAATHNIVFGGTLGKFSKYAAAAKPSATLQKAARNEVWKKTGLLA